VNDHQEMQFADPAWQPQATQASGAAPQAQAEESVGTSTPDVPRPENEAEHDYNQGYQGARTENYQAPGRGDVFQNQQKPSLQPQQPWYSRLPTWAWVLIIIALLGGFGGGSRGGIGGSVVGGIIVIFLVFVWWLIASGRMRVNLSGETLPAETRTFEVGTQPTIIVNNKAGSIRLSAGQEGLVSITTTKRGYLFRTQGNTAAQVWYNQDTANNTISARIENAKFFGQNFVDFEITVPPQANLQLVTNAGNIFVQNVAGQMKLQADAGSINATQVALQGRSRLKTDAGSITFTGELDLAGDYEFSTDLGNIEATLPAGASFNLDAKTDLGSISTNVAIPQSRTRAAGQVGIGPYPRLKLRTDVGSVRVFRG
jgi:hypothetical protein